MNETTERILIEALDLLEQGASLDEIIARYPAQAADLRPFLLTAAALGNLANQPTVTAEARSKRAFLAAADQAAAERNKPARAAGGWLRRLVAPALAVLAVLFLGGAGLVSASGSAVPGDALYETKRFVEEVRLNLTANPETAAQLRERFRQERLREIEALLADGRAADVSLTGEVESMADGRWIVAGVPVLVSSATVIDGRPVVGALVQVDGLTGDQAVVAERVMVLAADPAPAPAETETPAPSPTPRPSMTPVVNGDDDVNDNSDDDAPVVPPPGSQPVASPTLAPTAQPTSAPPAPTTAPPPPPTATPDDDDDNNANDNDDGNANDNDDGGGGDDNANDNGDDGGDDGGTDDNSDTGDDSAVNDNNDSDDSDDNANDNDGDSSGDNDNDGGNSGGGNSDDNDNGDADDDGGGNDDDGDD
jgi:hypothetical protein